VSFDVKNSRLDLCIRSFISIPSSGNAFPVFIAMCIFEMVASLLIKGKSVYRFDDTLASVSSGIAQQWITIFTRMLIAPWYIYIYENHR
jgi:hypothetical protein